MGILEVMDNIRVGVGKPKNRNLAHEELENCYREKESHGRGMKDQGCGDIEVCKPVWTYSNAQVHTQLR